MRSQPSPASRPSKPRGKAIGGKVAGTTGDVPARRARTNIKHSTPATPKGAGESRENQAIAKHLRLANLTMLMLEKTHGVAFEEIAAIPGYNDLSLKNSAKKRGKTSQREDDALRRRFERDRKALRGIGINILDRPSEISARHRTYYLDRTTLMTKPIGLKTEELMLLDLAVSSFEGERSHEIAQIARSGLSKLRINAGGHVPVAANATTKRRMSTRLEEERAFEALRLAHSRRIRANFSYLASNASRASKRVVEPFGFVLRGAATYVVAREIKSDTVKNFRLSRIRGAVTVSHKESERFTIPKGFTVASVFNPRLFSGGPGKPDEQVVVRFDADVGFIIANIFEGQVTMVEKPDGSLTASFPTGYPSELFRFLAEYAGHFEIVKPARIRRELAAHLADTLAVYGGEEV